MHSAKRPTQWFRNLNAKLAFLLMILTALVAWQWILNPDFGIQSVVRGWERYSFDPLHNSDIVIFGSLISGLWQGTGLVMVIVASGIIKLHDLVVAQRNSGPGISSEVPAKYVITNVFRTQNLGQGFAASTMMLVSVVIILVPWTYLEFGGKNRD